MPETLSLEVSGFISLLWAFLASVLQFGLAVGVTGHAVLKKRNTRSVIGWVAITWLVPFLGAFLYVCFGINRIERRGRGVQDALAASREKLKEFEPVHMDDIQGTEGLEGDEPPPRVPLPDRIPEDGTIIKPLARLVGRLTQRPLEGGNRVTVLRGGEEAFGAMLEAIRSAEKTVSLCTYIFDIDRAGREFVEAFQEAIGRGVRVRVLVDAVGARYGRPSAIRVLQELGIPVAGFMKTLAPRALHYSNLRNHRKILVVDGREGFTGGMNIREGNCLAWQPASPIQDLHFRVEGPVITHLQEAFAVDWAFTTGEVLKGDAWFPVIPRKGSVWARGIADGPDEDFETLRLTILGALAEAERHVTIVTPYFLPEDPVIMALNVAAMRGVDVRIVIPEINNLRMVQWASTAMLWQILHRGCRIWLSPPPFEHTKIFAVDDRWSLIGSANWDQRSLRLNFEFNVECYDAALAEQQRHIAEKLISAGREISIGELKALPVVDKLRNGVARLASPYL